MADPVEIVRTAMQSVEHGRDKMGDFFDAEASFFVPGSVYRIDTLDAYIEATRPFVDEGGSLVGLDIRQPSVKSFGETTIVGFHYVGRFSVNGIPSSTSGCGTAVIVGDRIIHLHITDITPGRATGVADSRISPILANVGLWGSPL